MIDGPRGQLPASVPSVPCDLYDSGDESPGTLHDQRLSTVLAALKSSGAASVLDLGSGGGQLLRLLLGERQFTRISSSSAPAPPPSILRTPNREYNALFPTLPADTLRHRDHRFEWIRAEFAAWCETIRTRFGYAFQMHSIGPEDATHGAPSQMGVFLKAPVGESLALILEN